MHLAWRWFTGLGFDEEILHHSTFSKKRHGRFQESKLFEQLFEQVVRQCVEVGLVQGQQLSVDGSFVEANAAKESRIPREQLAVSAQVHQTVRQFLRDVEEQNRWMSLCASRIRFRPPFPITHTRPKAARRRVSVTTGTMWWKTTDVSSLRLQATVAQMSQRNGGRTWIC